MNSKIQSKLKIESNYYEFELMGNGWQDMVMKDWLLCFEFCISNKIQILQQRWIRIT